MFHEKSSQISFNSVDSFDLKSHYMRFSIKKLVKISHSMPIRESNLLFGDTNEQTE